LILALAVVLLTLAALGLFAAWPDRLPVAPGAWLESSGLEPRFATVEGHRLRYVRVGSGPAVVLVHGFGSSLYTWKSILPALSPAHEVIALDLPGFGESDLPPDLSFGELPAAVLGLMDRQGIERAALVGSSMGGAVVAVVAAERPERVDALVLIDSAGFNLEPVDQPAMVRLATSPAAGLLERLPGKRLVVERALREVFHDERHVTDERLAEYLAGAQRPGGFAARRSLLLSLVGRTGVVKQRLSRIQAPTLVIWGREDRWVPLAHADLFVDAIPNARKVVLESCGHLPQEEKPREVGALLREILAPPEIESGEATSARERTASPVPSAPSGSGDARGR
jgi:pimeloyl-ACP methyl ester carboxylesterase